GFLTKLDPSGNFLWARNEMTGGYPTSIKIVSNEILTSGFIDNDTATIDTTIMTSQYALGSDAFLAKLTINGSSLWAQRLTGADKCSTRGFETDASNNIYLRGDFRDSVFIDGTVLHNPGKNDIFFCKFDFNGNLIWSQQIFATGSYGESGGNISIDSEGKFYLCGTFSGTATFDTFTVNAPNINNMFIARYDENGSCLGVRHFGEAQGYYSQVDNSGSVLVSGSFVNTVNIGSISLTSHGDLDMFFAKTDAITGIGGEARASQNQLIIYANPSKGTCNITVPDDFLHEKNLTLSIYDNTGKLIQQKTLQMNDGKIKLNLEAEAKGVYNVSLSNGKKSYNGKIVFE
ncbi:MAG TPA: T9SS type A sorting domain-containing protein, partial [Bacteroidia bacterium]|nr:T9SS type A sorting domain-containing protein [Bacteroidia bacterium]